MNIVGNTQGVTGYLLTNWGDGWQPPIPEVPINRGLAQTPPMGWNTWNQFQCNVSETLVKEMAGESLIKHFPETSRCHGRKWVD